MSEVIRKISKLTLVSAGAIILSVATNKIIALYAGPEGIGLMGLYRNLGGWVVGGLTLGFNTILFQRSSLSRSDGEMRELLETSGLLLAAQMAAVLLLCASAAGAVAGWLLADGSASAAMEIRIVLAMAWVNLALQTALAIIRGKADVKALALVQFSTSLATLLAIGPLVAWGRKGLAFNTASGSVIGAAVGFYYLWSRYRPAFSSFPWLSRWNALRAWAPASLLLSVQALASMGALVAVQAAVSRRYGLSALGGLNAAWLIIDTLTMIVMGSARTQLLASLGESDHAGKNALLSKTLALLLTAGTAAGLVLIVLGQFVLAALFSRQFREAGPLLAALSVSLAGQAFGWTYNTLFLHKEETSVYAGMELLWAFLFLSGALACARLGLPLTAVAWIYSACYAVYGAIYAAVAVRRHGRGVLPLKNVLLACACQAALLLAALSMN